MSIDRENRFNKEEETQHMITPDGSVPFAQSHIPVPGMMPRSRFDEEGNIEIEPNLDDEVVVDQAIKGIRESLPEKLIGALHNGDRKALVVPALGGLILFVGFVEFKMRGGQDVLPFIEKLHNIKENFTKNQKK